MALIFDHSGVPCDIDFRRLTIDIQEVSISGEGAIFIPGNAHPLTMYAAIQECLEREVPFSVFPSNVQPYEQYKHRSIANSDLQLVQGQYNFCFAFYSSGSTGKPKLVAHSKESASWTAQMYKMIYDLKRGDCVVCPLNSTYSFALFAGLIQPILNSVDTKIPKNSKTIESLKLASKKYGKLVVLADPFIAAKALRTGDLGDVIFDIGGAPVGRNTLMIARDKGLQFYEGYGLTETCTLTHFDTEHNVNSIGTVGPGLPGVKTRICTTNRGAPELVIDSPNIGLTLRELHNSTDEPPHPPKEIWTGDIGEIDDHGNVRLLGRKSDYCVNGYYPRDTVDFISSEFPEASCNVAHPKEGNVVVSIHPFEKELDTLQLGQWISRKLGVAASNVTVRSNPPLLHSGKIERGG